MDPGGLRGAVRGGIGGVEGGSEDAQLRQDPHRRELGTGERRVSWKLARGVVAVPPFPGRSAKKS